MPVYMYRREDGSTFEIRQSFADDPLTVDPATGQRVQRIVQAAGIVFKGSGFYVTDSKDSSRKAVTTPAKSGESGDAKPSDAKTDAKPAAEAKPAPVKADAAAAAD